ncbi:MAG: alternative ribosome rescue aminoacyl-tRNA hydrolase ArfB [Cyclobacteriaceae bacterium]
MSVSRPTIGQIEGEFKFSTSRSGGPGGQNVNKVNTKVTLKWDVAGSGSLSEAQRAILLKKLENNITSEGILTISSQEKRSQLQNKEVVLAKVDKLIAKAFTIKKKRKPTKPTKSSQKRRVDQKKKQAEKKEWRRKL